MHVYTCVYNIMHSIFPVLALCDAQKAYEDKVGSVRTPQNVLLKPAWSVQELQELTSTVCQLIVDIASLKDKLQDPHYDIVKENTAPTLKCLRSELVEIVKKLSKHQRTAATHIFVVMVSPESRSKKPYALPVQCLPIKALKDEQVRDIAHEIIFQMVECGMNVAGT